MSTITWTSCLQPCYAVPVHALPIPPVRPSNRTCPRRLLTALVGAEGPLGPYASGTPLSHAEPPSETPPSQQHSRSL
eukprot:5469388-Pyramimonas_sp.AAC.1